MESEVDCAIKFVTISPTGLKVAFHLESESVCILNIIKKSYRTVLRSHRKDIIFVESHPTQNEIATVIIFFLNLFWLEVGLTGNNKKNEKFKL
jgi:hypothetical protein